MQHNNPQVVFQFPHSRQIKGCNLLDTTTWIKQPSGCLLITPHSWDLPGQSFKNTTSGCLPPYPRYPYDCCITKETPLAIQKVSAYATRTWPMGARLKLCISLARITYATLTFVFISLNCKSQNVWIPWIHSAAQETWKFLKLPNSSKQNITSSYKSTLQNDKKCYKAFKAHQMHAARSRLGCMLNNWSGSGRSQK